MYLTVITWKANSGGSEDNQGSSASPIPGVDELSKPRIMFDTVKEKLERNGNALRPNVKSKLRYTLGYY